MYTGLLHSHKLFVTLFLVHYLVKTILLFSNQTKLASYAKKTKVVEMIVSFLFLATGVGLIFTGEGDMPSQFYIKLGMVFASIPLAIVGFKKSNKALAAIAMLLIIGSYGMAEMIKKGKEEQKKEVMDEATSNGEVLSGEEIYTINCIRCHGEDGDLGASGASALSTSTLSVADKKVLVRNGKGNMTAFGNVLTDSQINSVVDYIETLKQ
jgi:mono/diheme cytochrome c family protein